VNYFQTPVTIKKGIFGENIILFGENMILFAGGDYLISIITTHGYRTVWISFYDVAKKKEDLIKKSILIFFKY